MDSWQLALVAVAVLIALPHGAQDRPKRPIAYIATGLAVVVGWLIFPAVTIAAFLALAALHFGLSDTKPGWLRWAAVIAMGGSVLVLPAVFHNDDLTQQFAVLVGPSPIVPALTFLAVPWAVCAALTMAHRRERWALAGVVALYAVLPPLVAFAAYFAWHGLKEWRGLDLRRVTVAIGLLVAGFFALSGEPAVYRTLFVGLAAFAVPHIIWGLR